MASRALSIKLDFREAIRLADQVGGVSAQELGRIATEVTNEVAQETYELAQSRMLRDINLSQAYVESKMRLDLATGSRPTATITAFGSSGGRQANNTPLGRYDVRVVQKPAKTPRASGPRRIPGLQPGNRQAGVVVQVLKGAASSGFVPQGFLMPLRRGNVSGGNGMGVFTRKKGEKARHFYGPSPYQLFAHQVEMIQNEVSDDYADQLADAVNDVIQRQFR